MSRRTQLIGAAPRKNKVPRSEKKRIKREELAQRLKQLLAEIDREDLRVSVCPVPSGALNVFIHDRNMRKENRTARKRLAPPITGIGSVGMGLIIGQ